MATTFLTSGNDFREFSESARGSFVIDGLDGVDTISFGRSRLSEYTILRNTDGSIQVDSVSGASQVIKVTFYNVEILQFLGQTVDLRTLFDTVAPTVSSVTPADKATSVAVAADLVFNFSETIQKGSGSVTLSDATGKVVETLPISSSNITVSGSRLTVNPSADLAYNTSYTVQLPAGSVKDSAGNALAAATTVSFTTGSNPSYTGTANADVFNASAGTHVINGGAGTDTLVLGPQAAAAYKITHSGSSYGLKAADGSSSYTLTSVERLKFADYSVALDLDGNAGKTAKILGAVFGVQALSNKSYAGIGLQMLDSGTSYEALLKMALDVALGPTPSNKAVVDLLYTNVVGTAPTASEAATYVGLLDSGAYTPASLAAMAADSSINTTHINLIGLADTGLAYIPS